MAAHSSYSDEELMARLAKRDTRALEELYDRYARPLYSLALRMLGDRLTAEEVVQECFLKVWRTPERYQAQRGRALTWLFSIAHNRAVDELRRRRTERRVLEEVGNGAAQAIGEHPEEGVWTNLERESVGSALAGLPPAQRKVLELAYFEGMTQVEIAEHLGEPLGTVKTRVRLGMQKLRATAEAMGG